MLAANARYDKDEVFSEQEYIYRLSLEAAEALAAAAAMRSHQRPVHDDPLSLEAAEALTDVMRGPVVNTAVKVEPPPPPPPRSSPPTPERHTYQHRGKYRCGRCGQMKVNHVCPVGRAPLQRSLAVQTEPIFSPNDSSLLARPRGPRDRLISVRRWDARKRSLDSDIKRAAV